MSEFLHTFIEGTAGWTWGDLVNMAYLSGAGMFFVFIDYIKAKNGHFAEFGDP